MPLFSAKDVIFEDLIHYPLIEIEEGLLTSVSGESGSGKTTLLRLLNETLSAASGEIRYDGKLLEDYDPVALRHDVLLCGQAPYLFDGSLRDNFTEFYRYRGLPAPSDRQSRRYLELCAADFGLESDCLTLSGGERQRVFIAICLSFCPRVLLLDEPTSALDDATAHTMMARLKAFCIESGITLIVVSHNSALVAEFADRSITLESPCHE
ncbi:MAG: ATP-binding cassette domain-containing protein [Coriobacteriia bacterium]|nr:ATP-binding cassette domain-containing protein [Coriobacteriia bacterium]